MFTRRSFLTGAAALGAAAASFNENGTARARRRTTNQDYPRMLTTWRQRERREGIVVKKISVPVPLKSQDEIVNLFERAITPRTRVIHFCHITKWYC